MHKLFVVQKGERYLAAESDRLGMDLFDADWKLLAYAQTFSDLDGAERVAGLLGAKVCALIPTPI